MDKFLEPFKGMSPKTFFILVGSIIALIYLMVNVPRLIPDLMGSLGDFTGDVIDIADEIELPIGDETTEGDQ